MQDGVTALVAILDSKNERKPKAKDKLRDTGWWTDVYRDCLLLVSFLIKYVG